MLAVNITTNRVEEASETGGQESSRELAVQARAARWWTIADSTLRDYADEILAVEHNVVVGVFTVREWERDPTADNKVVFELAPAVDWQWLIGQESPVTWSKSVGNPVRKIGDVIISQLRSRRPRHVEASRGWSLTVDADGQSATVRGPAPTIAVTALHNGMVRLIALPDPGPGERS